MGKRGRKPSTERKGYFYEEQEQAVIDYINAEDNIEKDRIYMEKLYPAFTKMVESIIRRYKLYIPDEDYEDTFTDTLSFLTTKMDKFEAGKYKAYSYYGTICKNYLIGKLQSFAKIQERNPLYSNVVGDFNSLRYSDNNLNKDSEIASETIKILINKINTMLEEKDIIPLKENEYKLGKALVNLFENWDYVLTTDGSHKLNKSAILLFLKDSTGLDAKGIRDNMKKFKKEFYIIKNFIIQ